LSPSLVQTVDFSSLGLAVTGGSSIGEWFAVHNGTDASLRGFRVQSIQLDVFYTPPAVATVQLTGLEQTYTGSALAAGATVSPAGLDVEILYTIPGQPSPTTNPPVAVGSYPVTARVTTPGYTGETTGTLVISKASGTITFNGLQQAYTGTPRTVTASSTPAANIIIDYNGSPSAPVNIGTYPVTATIVDANVEGSAPAQLQITKASVPVVAHDIVLVQTGLPVPGVATTTPPGLPLNFVYNGLTTAPSLTGSYPYTATVVDPNREGTGTATIAILPTTPSSTSLLLGHSINTTISSQVSTATYSVATNGALALDGTQMTLSTPADWRHLTGQNSGHSLPGSFALRFTAWSDIDATTGEGLSPSGGSTSITSNAVGIGLAGNANGNFLGNTAGPDGEEAFIFGIDGSNLDPDSTLVVTSITLSQITTTPFTGNDSARIIRRGGTTSPVEIILGSSESPVSNQTINLTPLGLVVAGGESIPELFTIMNGTDGSEQGFRVSAIGIALLTRSDNPATIQISGLIHTYNGMAKPVAITTNPPGLDVVVTYAKQGDPPTTDAPVNAGSYQVDATVTTSGFMGSSIATLVLSKAVATVTAQNITTDYAEGTPVYGNATTQPPNLDLLYTYNNSESPPTNPGIYPYRAEVTDPNHTGFAEATITINAPNTYSYWAQVHTGGGPPEGDHDHDGMPNAIEYLMGETGDSFTSNPAVIDRTITWPKDNGAQADWEVEVSTDVSANSWESAPAGWVADTGTSIILTLPEEGVRRFARLKVEISGASIP
jgi:MBG domain